MNNLIPWRRKQDLAARQEGPHPISQLRQEVRDVWERFWNDRDVPVWNGMDHLEDQDKQYVLRADLPGFEPNEIDVTVSGNQLTVSAEHNVEEKDQNGTRSQYRQFRHSFMLPQDVLCEQIAASYHNGVLELRLPKSEERQAKRIPVNLLEQDAGKKG